MRGQKLFHFWFLPFCFLLFSCSVTKHISRQADTILLKDSAIRQGHIGISIYEPATGKYWYEHNATHYFIPASNTKLFSLYAGLKYLGDSLIGARISGDKNTITLYPSGDPTFLNPEFTFQPVAGKLKSYKNISVNNNTWLSESKGYGWAWDDYNEAYMTERSSFPIYNNVIRFLLKNNTLLTTGGPVNMMPGKQADSTIGFDLDAHTVASTKFFIERSYGRNDFYLNNANASFKEQSVPFITDAEFIADLLKDTLKLEDVFFFRSDRKDPDYAKAMVIRSQPVDSLFRPMMYRSDNFYAEQTLLMASNEHLGFMNEARMIDTLLKQDLKDIPQKPKWVDGSGLSRYNLFTPQSFVYILNKMKNEFGWERIKNLLPTGGKGTLASYYKKDSAFIYAKTGTLSNNCSLSGYLITRKGKLLIFSVLTNNYPTGATPVRRAVERFLSGIREKY